jgi:putative PIN family toxin of toxin-antitoxin system
MKVVIDTNVLVSAVLKDRDPETVILFVASRDDIEWVVSPEVAAEYREVLSRPKFGLPDGILQNWFDLLASLTVSFDTDLEVDFPRDRKDAKFLACAISTKADYFITGDRDFTGAQKLLSTTILSVAQFKRLVCERLS